MSSIREVAQLAGVSPATVSRVINGTARVDEKKKRRVLEVIEETGFHPNEVARSLFKKSSRLIGMIVPNIENPFINELAKAVEGEAYTQGYKVILFNSNEDVQKEKESIYILGGMNADGIIIMTSSEGSREEMMKCMIPIVLVDRQVKRGNEIAWLQADHYKGGRLATEHLIQCGCKNIVHMRGLQKYSSARQRFQGCIDACKEHNIELRYLDCKYNYEDGIKKSFELLKRFPDVDGVTASNDMVGFSLYKVLRQSGIKVPKDVQIIGFDNINLSSIMTPALTTVAQPISEMGVRAARIIINHVEGEGCQKENIFDVSLIKRETTIYKED